MRLLCIWLQLVLILFQLVDNIRQHPPSIHKTRKLCVLASLEFVRGDEEICRNSLWANEYIPVPSSIVGGAWDVFPFLHHENMCHFLDEGVAVALPCPYCWQRFCPKWYIVAAPGTQNSDWCIAQESRLVYCIKPKDTATSSFFLHPVCSLPSPS